MQSFLLKMSRKFQLIRHWSVFIAKYKESKISQSDLPHCYTMQ